MMQSVCCLIAIRSVDELISKYQLSQRKQKRPERAEKSGESLSRDHRESSSTKRKTSMYSVSDGHYSNNVVKINSIDQFLQVQNVWSCIS